MTFSYKSHKHLCQIKLSIKHFIVDSTVIERCIEESACFAGVIELAGHLLDLSHHFPSHVLRDTVVDETVLAICFHRVSTLSTEGLDNLFDLKKLLQS